MPQKVTTDEILNFAINEEHQAAEFYTRLASRAKHTGMRDTFLQFADEERGHKAKLVDILAGKRFLSPADEAKVLDLQIAEYTVDEDPNADIDYQGALLIAMKKEKAAFRLYTDMASLTQDPSIRSVLLGLAQEEAKHKLRFEIEYDERVLTDN
ncbi:MAG: ferritin family protein [Myxococcota bacterium]|jgi:rubrerythrin|nr:ferritin family protein [Myxococcota bacterium]